MVQLAGKSAAPFPLVRKDMQGSLLPLPPIGASPAPNLDDAEAAIRQARQTAHGEFVRHE